MPNARQGLTSPRDTDFQVKMPCVVCWVTLDKQTWCGHDHRRCKVCCGNFNKRVDESIAGLFS